MEPIFSFGEWVRRRRRALELTQAELAEQIGLAVVSIRKIEADERRPAHETALRLAAVLHIPAAEQELFIRAARAALPVDQLTPPVNDDLLALPTLPQPHDTPRALLPIAPNPLLGRERELAELQALLAQPDVRLVTITGPGGVGKTRLVLELAETLLHQHPDNLCFTPLAAITEPAMVTGEMLRSLGIRRAGAAPHDQLAAYLRDHRMILVLDNFEHLLNAAPDIATLLAAAPLCRFIITSRAPLHIRGEYAYLLEPLAIPPNLCRWEPGSGQAEGSGGATHLPSAESHLLNYPAVQLFAERAQAIQHDFTLSPANVAAIADICIHLDGLPLAIELAAAQLRILTPQALLEQLTRRDRSPLDMLTGGAHDLPKRQQTLRNTLAWSYQLLDSTEQALFRRLAVFTGGWTLAAAEAVVGVEQWEIKNQAASVGAIPQESYSSSSILDILQALVDQSLVRVAPGGSDTGRFEMLETIREFAHERMEAAGEDAQFRQRHAHYYAELAAVSDQAHRGHTVPATWGAALEADLANIRTAIAWSLGTPECHTLAIRLAGRLGYWWMIHGHQSEGRAWLEQALGSRPADSAPGADEALAYYWAGNLALTVLDTPAAYRFLNAGRALYQALDDADGVAYLDFALGRLARETGQYEQAEMYIAQALHHYRDANDWRRTAFALESLADIALDHGRTTPAQQWLWEAYDLFAAHSDVVGMNEALVNIARMDVITGDYAQAMRHLEQALELVQKAEITTKIQFTLLHVGQTATRAGLYDRALRYLEQANALARAVGDPYWQAVGLYELARTMRTTGNLPQAAVLLGKALTLLTTVHPATSDTAACLEELAGIAAEQHQPEPAARLFGAAAALRARIGIPHPPSARYDLERDLTLTRDQLDDERFRAVWAEGAALALPHAVDEALQRATEIGADYHRLR